MPEEIELLIELKPANVEILTRANGDRVILRGLHFTAPQASAAAWLANQPGETVLELQLKIKV